MSISITRRRFSTFVSAAIGAGIAPPLWALGGDEDARFNAFLENVWNRTIARDPILQSRLGIKRDQDKWPDVSDARVLEDFNLRKQDLITLGTFDREKLSTQGRISYRMFEDITEQAIAAFPLRHNDYLMTQMGGMHTRIPITLINSHPIQNTTDAAAYIKRIEGVGPLLDQIMAKLGRQEKAGVQPPEFVYALLLEPSDKMLRGKPFDDGPNDCPILADFRTKIIKAGLPQDELLVLAKAALTGSFGNGYRRLIAHLKAAQATADNRDGAWKLPEGARFYRQQLKKYTTLPIQPDAIHALGLREVARIHREMKAIMRKVDFRGTLQQFFTHVRTDPRFFYEDSGEGRKNYIAAAERLLGEIRTRQDDLFDVLPKSDVVVHPVETWREQSAAKAFYQNPPLDGSRPGIFYINLYDVKAQPKWQLAVTLYHEAIPGHHIETAIAHEMQGLPSFRRFASIAAFSEGWGLYSEGLPKEIGLYRNPYDDFGRLSLSLMRACRLVVDTGLHWAKWTREQAVYYMDINMPTSHYDNQREVDRYIVLPGQACSYYIGMQKILELRERARATLGKRFDLRAFHDSILGSGPLPLPILEEVINNWVATQKGTA